MYDGQCPVCGSTNLEQVYQDISRDRVELVYLCEDHEIVVEYGNPIVSSVRDGDMKEIPESEWEYA